MEESTRVSHPADPDRCQGMTANGQCLIKRMGVSKFCGIHGGPGANRSHNKKMHRNYMLRRWQDRVNQKADSPEAKGLREELGILRLLLESIINKCDTETDLILQSAPISELAMKIERTVASCHKLESSMGSLLDKQSILQFASSVITILSNHITDTDLLSTIADEITACVQ